MSRRYFCVPLLIACCATSFTVSHDVCGDDDSDGDAVVIPPFGLETRIPWTTSHVIGSPDPPLPYVAAEVFSGIEWNQPIYAKPEPGTENLTVIQKGGEEKTPTRIVRVIDLPEVDEVSELISVAGRQVYGLTFHPQYRENGFLYLFSNVSKGETGHVNRITRFTVSRDPDTEVACDPDTAQVIIEWKSMGHDGGDLVFGHDGMLYITSGDGTSDSDR